jgi:choline-sulfatase
MLVAAWLALALALPASASAEEKPNILFIAVDDLNDWVGCLGGHPQVKTPNIDRLARRGTLFTNAHCQAPLCNPSRSSLLTGLRPSTTGIYSLQPGIRAVPALKDHVTLPQHLAAEGYLTFCAGKVFHDGSIPPHDRPNEFQVWKATAGMPFPAKKFVETPDALRGMDWGIVPENDIDQADWKIADAAIAQLKAPPAGKPFFVAVGFRLPHVPCFASKRWFDLYPDESLVMPPVKPDDRDDVPEFSWYLHRKLPEPRLSRLKE